jgi:hypothetical protein
MKFRICLFLVLFVFLFQNLRAQSDLKLQSIFLYNFTRLIAWPDDYHSGDFIITIFGDSPIKKELEQIAATRRAGNQRIVIQQTESVTAIDRSHIIFIAPDQSKRIPDICSHVKLRNINALVVTDSRNAIKSGAMINFTNVDNGQKYEMCIRKTNDAGLKPGHDIIMLAILVE